jgi:hypothetical protein
MKKATHPTVEVLIQRIRGEYLEMPGLQLTDRQASRLWGLDTRTCQTLLRALVGSRFLTCTQDGRYFRAGS